MLHSFIDCLILHPMIIDLMLCFQIQNGEIINCEWEYNNKLSLLKHSHVKFLPIKNTTVLIHAFSHTCTSIRFHLDCRMWPTLVSYATRPPTSYPPNTVAHTHSPPLFFLWANLSDLSHPRAFSSVCPSWTPAHLSSSGSIPHGSAWSLALQLGLTPSGGSGGRDSAPKQQQSVKSFRLWQRDLSDVYTASTTTGAKTHTHRHSHMYVFSSVKVILKF